MEGQRGMSQRKACEDFVFNSWLLSTPSVQIPPPVPVFLLCLFPSPFQVVQYSVSSCLMKGCSVGEYYVGGQKLVPWPMTAQFQDLGPG